MAELADALDSGSSESNFMKVQVLLPAPPKSLENTEFSRLFAFYFPLSYGGRGDARPAPRSDKQNVPDNRIFLNYFLTQKKPPDFYGQVAMYNVQLDK